VTAAWMAYALVVGTLVALAAYALDGVCRIAARPSRWVWAGAMAVTVALLALAPQRESHGGSVVLPVALDAVTISADAPAPAILARVVGSLGRARSALEAAAAHGFASVARLAPAPVARVFAMLWTVLSLVAFLVFFAVHHRLRRARRTWPVAILHGARVRIAPDAGPAVVGVANPEIVIPRWLLQRSAAEQRMVIAHEAEHLRAHDALVLSAACAAASLVAWHPAMWWMLARLRLAVELDCDGRIVRSGIAPRSYGALLIELAGRCSSGMRISAPALADGSSHLERRLIAMTPQRSKFARASACALAACSLALLALACDAKLPTSEEVNSMNVFAAEGAARRVAFLAAPDSSVSYTIDGRKASAAEAHALAPEEIASINVVKTRAGENGEGGPASGEVHIVTRLAADSLAAAGVRKRVDGSIEFVRKEGVGGEIMLGGEPGRVFSADTVRIGPVERKAFDGVLVVDGVPVDRRELAKISPDQIKSVEVVKGEAARKLYSDSAAANGVIRITTKRGAGQR